ncbi:MAG: endolytic transglycosylase MltG [Candidatus Margulisbacteria bacterium]|nr:endolytic transglycosylase MltG [Candidatus Margulisiibacteriota bacterium]
MKNNIILTTIAFLIVCLAFILQPANPFDRQGTLVAIPAGSSAKQIKAILAQKRLLPPRSSFLILLRLFGLQDKVKAGEYLISPSMFLPEIIIKLVANETVPPKQIRVTFPEGSSIYKMGEILKASRYLQWQGFQTLVNEGITAERRAKHYKIFRYISSESPEGYLFPDTYDFFPEASLDLVVETMLRRFEAVILPFWDKEKGKTKLTLHEILTLASIVEKEAKIPAERPIIASVFYNRLKIGMPLAADPTVKYALENPSKKVFLNQLNVDSPYNTYKRAGLPPGPICNPGLDSIKAAINPAKTDFLFFVARSDGSHKFSKSFEEHKKARGKR